MTWETPGVLLYVDTAPQEGLSLLVGVGKTSIHTWIYAGCGSVTAGTVAQKPKE